MAGNYKLITSGRLPQSRKSWSGSTISRRPISLVSSLSREVYGQSLRASLAAYDARSFDEQNGAHAATHTAPNMAHKNFGPPMLRHNRIRT